MTEQSPEKEIPFVVSTWEGLTSNSKEQLSDSFLSSVLHVSFKLTSWENRSNHNPGPGPWAWSLSTACFHCAIPAAYCH